MVEVPTGNDVKQTAMSGGLNGTALALGETLGRSVLGPGLGTAIGGVGAASALSGTERDTAAMIAVERGMTELFAGGSGGNRQGVK